MKNDLVAALICLGSATAFGADWTSLGTLNGGATDFSSLSASQTWICTSSGYIYFYDGATLSAQTNLAQATNLSLQAIHAVDARHVWATGYAYTPQQGRVYCFNGSKWMLVYTMTNTGVGSILRSIYAASTSHVWVCGNPTWFLATTNGGVTWTQQFTNSGNHTWHVIDGTDAAHVWAAGIDNLNLNAQVMAWDGANWTTNYSLNLAGAPLDAMDVVTSNDIWAVGGTNSAVVRFQNGAWQFPPALNATNASSRTISATSCGDTWACAFGRGLFMFNGAGWTAETNLSQLITRVAASPWHVFAVDSTLGVFLRRVDPELARVESGIGFSWRSVPGRTYRIEWTDALDTNNWRAADQITAGGWTTYWGDIGDGTTNRPPPTNSLERLYRVVQP